ncbi:MAG: M3 family metallopeptidase [Akkermansiaceae bacterium]|nr:M3 family metallopeptidase [Akkermansiaceae bacterium]
MSAHPFLSESFYVPWSQLTPDRVEADIEAALAEARARIEEICAVDPAEVTFENTFGALDNATEVLDRGWGRLNHLDSVRNDDAQREVLNKMLPKVSAFQAGIPLNERLWTVLKAFAESEAVAALDPVKRRLVEEDAASFRNAGADLPADKKERMAAIQEELSELTQKFSENVLDSTNAWELVVDDEARLAGLPPSAVAAARADAAAKGHGSDDEPKWRFTLQFPSMFPVMQYAHDESLRKEVFEGSGTIGRRDDYDNSELVWKILARRDEKAKLLGFDHFADLVLQRRMAKEGATALDFVEDLHDRIVAACRREYRELQDYKAEQTGTEPAPLEPWETTYWSEKRRKDLFDFDDEDLRPYFPVEKVMTGLFGIASKLFGIRIEERDSIFIEPGTAGGAGEDRVEVWNPDVTFYDLFDAGSGEQLGSFYADWHPRESKRGGAWMNYLQTGLPPQGVAPRKPHLGLICGNMTKPVGGKPALLTHDEVETIFHEFGHLLHQLLSDVPLRSLSGVNVAWDFVELPSQIMENFCWDRESLDFFARHHETGEVIPDALFDKMIAARNYMSASTCMRQLALGKLDLELHIHLARYQGRDLDELDREILADYKMPLASETPTMARRFGHLFGDPTGYAAGYYSYKWAEVLDADAFTRFQKEGILNPAVGKAFRETILSRGNSRPPEVLFRDFMGRDPSLQPFLERSGLAPPDRNA